VEVHGSELGVLGSGGAYLVDASDATWSNIADGGDGEAAAIHGVRLHLLAAGDRFDLAQRLPLHADPRADRPAA
jgi:cyanophycinase